MGSGTASGNKEMAVVSSHVQAPQAGVQQFEATESAKYKETILLVEDEDCIRDMTRRILEMHGYMVLTAHNASEGIRTFEEHHGAIELVVTDVVMPGMDGRQLVHRLVQRTPGLKAIFMSGYDSARVCSGFQDVNVGYIQKPFTLDELARKVREVIDGTVYPGDKIRPN